MKRYLFAILIVLSLLFVGYIGSRANSASAFSQVSVSNCLQLLADGELLFESDSCFGVTPTPEPSPTPIAEVTPTVTPVFEPEPDDTLCEEHGETVWHGLYNYEKGCHYDHEHKDNPHELDSVFGDWLYSAAGGSISYPWATVNENHHKHQGYGWIVYSDLNPDYSSGNRSFIKNIRIQAHLDLNAVGQVGRFHSSYFELQICLKENHDECGIMRYGGWQDYGEFRVDGNWVPLGDIDPIEYDGVEPPAVPRRDYDNLVSVREHAGSEAANAIVSWQGRFGNAETRVEGAGLSPHIYSGINHLTRDAFTLADPDDPTNVILAGPPNDNTTHMIRSFVLRLREQFAVNGFINFSGYTNRYGSDLNEACTSPAADCVPIVMENVPMHDGDSLFLRFPNELRDYDIYFDEHGSDGSADGQSSGWVEWYGPQPLLDDPAQ